MSELQWAEPTTGKPKKRAPNGSRTPRSASHRRVAPTPSPASVPTTPVGNVDSTISIQHSLILHQFRKILHPYPPQQPQSQQLHLPPSPPPRNVIPTPSASFMYPRVLNLLRPTHSHQRNPPAHSWLSLSCRSFRVRSVARPPWPTSSTISSRRARPRTGWSPLF